MDPPPLLVSFALQFFSVIEMNARHPSHFAVKYTVSAATASSPLARWSERHWLSCYDGTWREIRCTMKPLNTQKISPRLWVTLIWAVVYITSFYCVCSAILEVTRTWTWVEGSTPHQELIISNIPLDSHHKKPKGDKIKQPEVCGHSSHCRWIMGKITVTTMRLVTMTTIVVSTE